MIRMQKQKEEAKKEAERLAAMEVVEANESEAKAGEEQTEDCKEEGGLSLLGIGGKQIKGGVKKAGKKRNPGEIRIQKGKKEFDLFLTF